MRYLVFLMVIVASSAAQAQLAGNGSNLLKNGDFENRLNYWRVDVPIEHRINGGAEDAGRLYMHAPLAEDDGAIHEVNASQCVPVGQFSKFRLDAQFQYEALPKASYGHRVNLIWYETEDCTRGGQFGTYLEPKITPGWQSLQLENITPALNARAVKVMVTQNRLTSIKDLNFLQRIYARFLKLLKIENTSALANGYWDNLVLMATESAAWENDSSLYSLADTLPPERNYLKNAGFDQDISYWHVHDNYQWLAAEGYAQAGAVRITLHSDSGSMGTGVLEQCVNFGGNQSFALGAKFKIDAQSTQSGGGRLRVIWHENENCHGRSAIGDQVDPAAVTGWQSLIIPLLRAPVNSKSASIQAIQAINGIGDFSVYWDDFYFKALGID